MARRITIVDSVYNPKKNGVLFRKSRSGPEEDLVDWFLKLRAVKPKPGERLTIFREPRLPSGFPDIVAVIWKESVSTEWRRERRFITPGDLRVMHYLAINGPTEECGLKSLFGREIERSLEKLMQSEMVIRRRGLWTARPLSKTFAIRRIVAIEAKMNAWRAALDQAFINTWFTPESYILVPEIPKRTDVLDIALQRGVRVLSREQPKLVPQSLRKPRSYASWLLNEWTWRVATT